MEPLPAPMRSERGRAKRKTGMIWSLVSPAMSGVGITENQPRKWQSVTAGTKRVARTTCVARCRIEMSYCGEFGGRSSRGCIDPALSNLRTGRNAPPDLQV